MQRLTETRKRILVELYHSAPEPRFGLEISRASSIPSGSLYPALRALRQAGLLEASWKAPEGDPDGQPVRYYRLSPNGFELASRLAAGRIAGPAWRRFLPNGGTT